VWSVIGGIAATTKKLRLGTAVTCPTMRIHPAIIAQAAATAAAMMPGRFFIGVGTGENLNEHISGRKWPPASVRQEMLEEAVRVIRLLWKGGTQSHRGRYFTVENARLYTLPEKAPPIYVAAGGKKMSQLAARIGDGLITAGDEDTVIKAFNSAGGKKKPKYAQITVCWARTEKEARRIAHEWWPIAALPWSLLSELALPKYFEEAAENVTEDAIAEAVICGPDPEKHIAKIRKVVKAGADRVFIHQIGKDQEGFFRFYERQILPEFGVQHRRAA
jgi:coenzyme F420-dependent glucose-6-phosphate dehydrogenase